MITVDFEHIALTVYHHETESQIEVRVDDEGEVEEQGSIELTNKEKRLILKIVKEIVKDYE